MAEFIDILSPSALKDLQTANTEVLTLIKNIDNAGKAMQNVKTPSGSDSAVKNLNDKLIRQEKLYIDLQIKLEKYTQAQQQSIIKNNQVEASTIRLNKAKEQSIKQAEREQAKLEASQQLYNKVQQKLNSLSNEYKQLATAKSIGIKQTDDEAKRMEFLLGKITKYDTALKAVDATMGKHARNVGNYTNSGFNPLSNSINQLTREMPAFTYSVQTGFMALSNNIPIFTDAISNAISQNKELQAQGKPTTSILSQLAGAFLSWQTLMGVGITLLTVYGKEIGEFISKAFKAGSAIDAIKESQKELNIINQEGAKNAVEETLKLKSLLAIAKDTALSYKERMIAVNELQDTYPAYFGNLKEEEILAGNTTKAENALTEAILSRAKANAAVGKITENQAKIIDFELEKLNLQKQLTQATEDYEAVVKRMQKVQTGKSDVDAFKVLSLADTIQSLKKDIINIDKEIEAQEKINNTLTNFAIKNQKESILLNYKEEKSTKDKTKAKEKDLEVTEKINSSSLNALQKTISALKESYENAEIGSVQYGLLANQIKLLQTIYDGLTKSVEASNEAISNGEGIELNLGGSEFITDEDGDRLREEGDRLREILRDFKQGFIDDFADQSGFSLTLDLLSGGLDKFEGDAVATALAVSEAFQQAFNTISQMSNANYEVERENLQKQYDNAILFANGEAGAIAEINRQKEAKERDIRNRQAKANKNIALFNIALNTAQGIVAALTSVPPNVPLSIGIGIIGAAQLAVVASQQIPQYFRGTDNHKGGLMQINDGGGSNFKEIVQTPDGKMRMYNERDKVLNAPKGTKVFTAQKSMDMLSFDNNLNNILLNSGIGNAPKIEVNNQGMSDAQVDRIVSTIQNKTEYIPTFNQNGFNMYVRNGHSLKEIKNKSVNFDGNKVG